ncbi:MAG: class I SAM-dependent methyltransferase [Mesorhizobium sp.]|uniref:class I SAM-dependent methyltransferase n=1 Tax=Mesorhizobium sp. TaxID=1871066 RepID=UPI000FE58F79|nr:class I SAM-dependent methyltransferase [Mesorhizobium sp.]RWH69469.1 MAG: class I SAM-dependent methyltransferase [Mesorhizobium sp.]RWH76335.1 MAG: class I SAM-dependent methyltransferase [Mesorhizobium sp.]RWH83535.1 MAG: class I SAM-dependent methyltransferase [Mesorhizobium sp.]RWH91552.1 MAG: class I SAM-dependent methyltransferase [Mesorhizobium sp.]RWH95824.1 MAG: class I SAM-dependent methyltransferase [Mesorhizobium sp.]
MAPPLILLVFLCILPFPPLGTIFHGNCLTVRQTFRWTLPVLGAQIKFDLGPGHGRIVVPFWKSHKKYSAGTWDDRLDGLFSCGVKYFGKTILDVGCNMGIVAYEIAKRRPAYIHGIDILKPHTRVARSIFLGSNVESRFDAMNLGSRKLQSVLNDSYDIVLLLAVYQHVRRGLGQEEADRIFTDIINRAQTIVARVPDEDDIRLQSLIEGAGFTLSDRHKSPRGSTVLAYHRH